MSNYRYSPGQNIKGEGQKSQGVNQPGGEQAMRRTGKGAKKPDTNMHMKWHGGLIGSLV